MKYSNMDVKFLVFGLCVTAAVTWSYADEECGSVGGYFEYTIKNQVQKPTFLESMKLKICENDPAPLIRYMEDAVMINPTKFKRFKATFSSPYGYFIDSINNVAGDWKAKKTYWQISNSSGALKVGVSSYIPSPGDKILFNFVSGKCPPPHGKLLFGVTDGDC